MAGKIVRWESPYWPDAKKLWDEIPVAVQNEAMKSTLSKAAEPIAARARELAPTGKGAYEYKGKKVFPLYGASDSDTGKMERKYGHGPGFLKRSIGWKAFRHQSKGAIRAIVGFHPYAYYGWFVELGTSKMQARPFLRPAWEENKEKALGIVAFDLERILAITAKRQAVSSASMSHSEGSMAWRSAMHNEKLNAVRLAKQNPSALSNFGSRQYYTTKRGKVYYKTSGGHKRYITKT